MSDDENLSDFNEEKVDAKSIESQLKNLNGKAKLEYIEKTDFQNLLSDVPKWIKYLGYDYYRAWLSISTVSLGMSGFNFIPNALYELSRVGDYENGHLLQVEYYNGIKQSDLYKMELFEIQQKSKRGRKSQKDKKGKKRQFGSERSFGTTVEYLIRLNIPNITKNLPYSQFYVKVFNNSFQIASCRTENLSDAKLCILLIKEILTEIYQSIPEVPLEFNKLVTELSNSDIKLNYIKPEDLDNIQYHDYSLYLSNYNFHPLFITEDENNLAISLIKLYNYFNDKQRIQEIADLCGLHYNSKYIEPIYTYSSDSTTHRMQIKFYTPRYVKGNLSTTVIIQNSGKISIHLSNNYYWKDVLWRIIGFLIQLITDDLIVSKIYVQKLNSSSIVEDITEDEVDEYLKKYIYDSE